MSDANNTTGELRTVELSEITVENGFNPRSELEELVASVARHGILQPLLVRPGENGSLVLVDGHRRLAAAAQAGTEQLPVLVREDLDGRALVAAMVTALEREDLDPVEEAKAYGRLLAGGLTRKGAAQAVGVTQKTITVRLAILEVPEQLHPAIATGEIALSSVPALVGMAKVSAQLAELVGRASPDRIDARAAERVISEQQGKHGLRPATNIDIERLKLDAEQHKQRAGCVGPWRDGPPFGPSHELGFRPCSPRPPRASRETHRPGGAAMSPKTTRATDCEAQVLATYQCDEGTRRLVGERIDGKVALSDVPAGDRGKVYLVERHVPSMDELEAIVADYLTKAELLAYAPMHGWL